MSTLAPEPQQVLESLYDRYARDVYRYALAVLRNPADAEDVTQTTFMNAYRAIVRGERPEKPQHWLIVIAHNACRTRAIRASRRPREVPLDATVGDVPVPEAERPNLRALLDALGELPFNQRSALVMRELEGRRTYEEIAEALGVTVAAVETLIVRARRSLRLRKDALGGLAVVELPASLYGFGAAAAGGGGAALLGGAAVLKIAGLVAALLAGVATVAVVDGGRGGAGSAGAARAAAAFPAPGVGPGGVQAPATAARRTGGPVPLGPGPGARGAGAAAAAAAPSAPATGGGLEPGPPGIRSPSLATPPTAAPGSTAPAPTTTPALTTLALTTPALTTPALTTPAVTTPAVTLPAATAQALTVPALTVPAVTATVPQTPTVPGVTVPALP